MLKIKIIFLYLVIDVFILSKSSNFGVCKDCCDCFYDFEGININNYKNEKNERDEKKQ